MRLIDADALIDRLYNDAFETDTDMQKWDSGCWVRYKLVKTDIDEQPTIKPKKGKWIRHENPRYSYDREQGDVNAGVHYTCSECNHISWTYNYCPNCGADMRGLNDEH